MTLTPAQVAQLIAASAAGNSASCAPGPIPLQEHIVSRCAELHARISRDSAGARR